MKIETDVFNEDGRVPIEFLFQSFDKLKTANWKAFEVYKYKESELPVLCFASPKIGPALWVFSGVHGEEPAGPNAISRNVNLLIDLAKTIPLVVFPLLNPVGYIRDWRYPNERRDWHNGHSVSNAEHLLLGHDGMEAFGPRISQPESKIAEAVTLKIMELVTDYPPLISIDHHEDELFEFSYIYSQGETGSRDPVAKKIVEILKSIIPVQENGQTRFGEKIENGIVINTNDGSVDELMSAELIFLDGFIKDGPSSPHAIVVETPIINTGLEKRIAAHEAVIKSYKHLFEIAEKNYVKSGH